MRASGTFCKFLISSLFCKILFQYAQSGDYAMLRFVFVAIFSCYTFFGGLSNAQSFYALNASTGSGAGGSASASATYASQASLYAGALSGPLGALLPSYNGAQDVTITFNSNGIVATLNVKSGATSSGTLIFTGGPNQPLTFTGPTNDGVVAQATNFILREVGPQPDANGSNNNGGGKNNGGNNKSSGNNTTNDTPQKPLRGKAALRAGQVGPNTPVDLIAGNPGSLMSRMVANDFEVGTRVGFGIDLITVGAGGARPSNPWGVTGTFGFWSAVGVEIALMELPFSYLKPLDDPRYAFVVEAPISLIGLDGKQAISASIGTGVRLPMTNDWNITPIVRLGAATSEDLGLEGFLWSASIVSDYITTFNDLEFGVGNQITHVRTIPIAANDYDLQNTVIRNGVGLAGPTEFKMFGENATWEATLVNTQYFGDELYVENQTDLGISLGTRGTDNGVKWDSARVGLTISLTDHDYSGFSLNFGYKF